MIVLLSGIPATGKSTFGRWLAQEKDFVHVDVEKTGVLAAYGLENAWNQLFESGVVRTFIERIKQLGPDVVLDWGFPPQWLEVVRQLQAAGVEAWWFDGDRVAARRSFLARGDVSVDALDRQMSAIDRSWQRIKSAYDDRMIMTIDADGRFKSAPEIWTVIALESGRSDP